MPPHLQLLMDRLAEQDWELAPSIVPSIDDMEWRPKVAWSVGVDGATSAPPSKAIELMSISLNWFRDFRSRSHCRDGKENLGQCPELSTRCSWRSAS